MTGVRATPETFPLSRASPDPGPGWKLRYWLIFIGQAMSLLGSALTQFVLMWWITDTTGSVSALATAGLVALLPQALLGPLGGVLADRYSRRLVMVGADAISASCMVVLILQFISNTVELWHIYTMMFVRSAMQAFQAPALAASAAMLVPASFLPRAAGFNQTLQGLMIVAAAPLGALAMGLMPIGWALGIDVITAFVGILPLVIFRIPQQRMPGGPKSGIWEEMRAGVRVVWADSRLRQLYGLIGAVVLVIMPSATLVPLLVKEHFGGGAPEVALMEALWGIGMVTGGMIVAALAPQQHMRWILWGLAVACFALAAAGLVPGNLLWLACVWWVVSAISFIMGEAPLTVLLQTTIPNHLHGRVLSLLSTVMGLAAPVGLVLAAPLGELLGTRWLFILTGAIGGCVSLLGFFSRTLMTTAPNSSS